MALTGEIYSTVVRVYFMKCCVGSQAPIRGGRTG